MARGRSGGAGYAIALVAVGFLFFIALIFAVIFFVQSNTASAQAAEAREQLEVFVNDNERENPEVQALKGGDQSVIGALLEQRRQLKRTIFADPNVELSLDGEDGPIATMREQLGVQYALEREIQDLKANVKALEERQQSAQTELDQARAKFQSLSKIREQTQAAFQQAKDALSKQSGQAIEEVRKALEKAQQGLNQAQSEQKDIRSQAEQQVRESQQSVQEMQSRIAQLENIVRRLREELGTTVQLTEVTPADGKVVSIDDESKSVYVNRGSNDQVLLGMTFEVFGPDELIKLNEYEELRGKATIEIFQIDDATSRGRIVRQEPGSYIRAGDQIANLVYDPNATYAFYIHGDFDLDQDGQTTRAERRRIEALVRDWGGEIADELTYDVDFLVLGERPELPAPLPDDVIDPRVIAEHRRQMQAYETYTELEAAAKQLSIPVLNQNRFYALVGLYEER